jgi:hypothetical protein
VPERKAVAFAGATADQHDLVRSADGPQMPCEVERAVIGPSRLVDDRVRGAQGELGLPLTVAIESDLLACDGPDPFRDIALHGDTLALPGANQVEREDVAVHIRGWIGHPGSCQVRKRHGDAEASTSSVGNGHGILERAGSVPAGESQLEARSDRAAQLT